MNRDDLDPDSPERLDLRKLSAFVDGELTQSEQAAVQARLESDPESAARVAAWRAQKAALKALFGDTERDEPSVMVLRPRVSRMQRMAAAASWVIVGIALGATAGSFVPLVLESGGAPAKFARRADMAYAVYAPEVRHPVEVGAQDEPHLTSWLSKRLGRPISIPSLQEYGYTLVGGRLVPGETGPAAQFMYENRSGARLTLYIAQSPTDQEPVRLLRDGERRTFYWSNDHFGYALSGAMSETKLHSIAVDVCSDLGGRPQLWQSPVG